MTTSYHRGNDAQSTMIAARERASGVFSTPSLMVLLAFLFATQRAQSQEQETYPPVVPEVHNIRTSGFTESQACRKCHSDIYKDWAQSMHFQAYTDPIFQLAFLQAQVREGREIRPYCLSCHAPTLIQKGNFDVIDKLAMEGVTCDFCHSVVDVDFSVSPHRFVIDAGAVKYGPFKDSRTTAHYNSYSELHTKSEFCGGCHELRNDLGAPIMETYSEWKEGPYSKLGIECQNCHMPLRYDVNVVDPKIMKPKHNATAHEFQGGHSQINLRNAAKLDVFTQRQDDQAIISVYITNAESGHKIPTGTPARKIILKLIVTDSKDNVLAEMSRVYRKVLVDKNGLILENNADQILYATKVFSDNRIRPKETRQEDFVFDIPPGVESIHVKAELNYEFITPLMMTREMIVNMASSESVLPTLSSTTFLVETKWWIIFLSIGFILAGALAWVVRKKRRGT